MLFFCREILHRSLFCFSWQYSKRLKVNSRILDGYTGILNLESQIDLLKRRRYTAFCLSYTHNLPHNIIANFVCKIKLGFFSIVFSLLSILFFFLSSHSTQRQELMYGSILCVCLSHSNSLMPLSLSTRPALDCRLTGSGRQGHPPPILTMCPATADQNGRLVSQ